MTEPTRTEPTGFDGNQPQPPDLWARNATESEAKKAASAAPGWERELLEKLVLGTLAEQRAARRWRNFWRFGWLVLIVLVGWAVVSRDIASPAKSAPHTAVVDVKGEIAAGAEASAEFVVAAMRSAFEDSGSQAVVLLINSPGGSPVQAGMINDEVHRLRAGRPDLPVVAVVEDMCASGGYYVAVAADKIMVDKASLVGSIGVLMDGFGFVGAMDKLGVERRLLSAGANKGFLDPFSPQRDGQLTHARGLLDDIHRQFIEVVRKGRGDRLKDAPELFSGLIWTGARSVELGLADGFGTVESVARDVFQAEDVRDFTEKRSFAERFAQRFGATLSESVVGALTRVNLR